LRSWRMDPTMGGRELCLIAFGSIIAYAIASSIIGIMWIQGIIKCRRKK